MEEHKELSNRLKATGADFCSLSAAFVVEEVAATMLHEKDNKIVALENLLRRALCYPIDNELQQDIINILNL